FPETPETFAPKVAKWAENSWLNLVGGCCGTTPEHIRAIAKAVRGCKPREFSNSRAFTLGSTPVSGANASPARAEGVSPSRTSRSEKRTKEKSASSRDATTNTRDAYAPQTLHLSGLEPLNITPEFGFAVIG